MSAARWFYVENESRLGPVDFEQLVQLLASGTLPGDTLVWYHGMKAWTEAASIPEIAEHLPPPLPPDIPPPLPATTEPPPIPARKAAPASAPTAGAEGATVEPFRIHAVDKPDGRVASSDPVPIPLVAADEPFEIERSGDFSHLAPRPATATTPAVKDAPAKPPVKEAAARPATTAPATVPPASRGATATLPREAKAPAPASSPPPVPAIIPDLPIAPAPAPTAAKAGAGASAAASAAARPAPGAVSWPNGRLADHDFPDLVREVYARAWSGLLTLNLMGVEKSVRVQDGRLVFASSSSKDDRLGELLLRKGRITLHQFVAASRAIKKNKRLGTILVEEGAIDARELVRAVTEHTQEIIYGAFQWTEGMYHFTEGEVSPEEITLKLSTPDIIMEGIRRIEAWSRIERGVGDMDTRYAREEHFDRILPQINLSIEKLSVMTGLSAVKDVGTICRESNLSHFEVCRLLWAFRVIGVVRRLS